MSVKRIIFDQTRKFDDHNLEDSILAKVIKIELIVTYSLEINGITE